MVMKNCEPFVFFPAFAIERRPGFECLSLKFSSTPHTPSAPHPPANRTRRALTLELLAVDRLAAGAITLRMVSISRYDAEISIAAYAGEVATLEHEVGDDTVEGRALVAEAVLARRKLAEVARGLGDHVVVELEGDAAERLAVDGDVKLRECANCQRFSAHKCTDDTGGLTNTFDISTRLKERKERWSGAEQRGPLKRHLGKARSRSSALKSSAVTIGHNRSHNHLPVP